MDKKIISIIVFLLLIFGVIVSITGLLGKYLGKEAEMMILGIIAVILLVMLLLEKNKKD